MMLPEITQEILDARWDEGGLRLIVWEDKKPQWTQTAVDFARLVAPRVAELEAEIERMRTVVDAVRPFHDLAIWTSGRIPTERLSGEDWHSLWKAFENTYKAKKP